MSTTPDRLYMDKADRDLYNDLNQEQILKFKDRGGTRTRKEQFLLAMAFGFHNSARRAIRAREGLFLAKDLHSSDTALLNAVAIAETGNPDVVLDKGEVFRIAEEFAHGGIRLLKDRISSSPLGSFEKRLEKDLRVLAQELHDR